MASFKLDEGFSEEVGFMDAQEDENTNSPQMAKAAVEEWIMAQDEGARKEIAFEILRTLRSSTIASIIGEVSSLLHHDPVQRLPAEITAEVFAYLDAPVLLNASLVCKAWRHRVLDSPLWKRLYIGEGWGIDRLAVQEFEETLAQVTVIKPEVFGSRQRDSGIDVAEPKQKRRAPSSWLDDRQRNIQLSPMPMDNASSWNEQHGKVEADVGPGTETSARPMDLDQDMQDVSSPIKQEYQSSAIRSNKRSSRDASFTVVDDNALFPSLSKGSSTTQRSTYLDLSPALKPSLTLMLPSGLSKLNWLYLYKQRRRLEENWIRGRYVNYQLPQVGYEYEGHRECVYTVQFFGKWLVTGSRDHTMRVWDLDTKRLRGPPLVGHTQSVLCLQFDPTPDEDVIISGGSDTRVLIWRFSTGQLMYTLQAHREAVLNLRFDRRYLVTCSKDKLIKVWNRREMDPLSPHYPKVNARSNAHLPSYIIDTSQYTPLVLEQKLANRTIRTLQPYSLIMQLDGHSAAVNAIQIEGDRIVSASGDRTIKIWDVRDGKLLHTLIGHNKGIACVQFDSKRIISGSSDDSIRIFDSATGAEVACLFGHDNLVRTVQAGFGDLPGNEAELKLEAEKAEREWRAALERGDISKDEMFSHRRSRHRNRGSYSSRNIMAIGAALPPGGGGSRWGRIVSGSYDEHIIIWKKQDDNRWVPAHRLSHYSASHIATAIGTATQARVALSQTDDPGRGSSRQVSGSSSGSTSAPPILPGETPNSTRPTTTIAPASPNLQLQGQNPGAQQALHQLQHHAQMMNNAISQRDHQTLAAMLQPNTQPPALPPALAAQIGAHGRNIPNATGPHRVFKLQFDSRKIVCCSQDPRVVVWDYANGDKDIEECTKFFVGP